MEQRLLARGKVFWLVLGERYGDFATVNYGRTWLPSKITRRAFGFTSCTMACPFACFISIPSSAATVGATSRFEIVPSLMPLRASADRPQFCKENATRMRSRLARLGQAARLSREPPDLACHLSQAVQNSSLSES